MKTQKRIAKEWLILLACLFVGISFTVWASSRIIIAPKFWAWSIPSVVVYLTVSLFRSIVWSFRVVTSK